MSDRIPKRYRLPYLGDDVLFKIFVKCHPKIVGRLRALNKYWSVRLKGLEFAKENWAERKGRADTGDEIAMDLPFELVDYSYFNVVDTDLGNICLRYAVNGHNSKQSQGYRD
ncbi:hypothetical protein PIB30_064162 [Stylosanthes scabra]|uniref:Uncharacterized protein n=1 Tax=Stylosanthes scabra TaxID=79078 RepID=A0ABU6WJY5_9FABA|nr:hypothetical protein [Stylosanthes scabra]